MGRVREVILELRQCRLQAVALLCRILYQVVAGQQVFCHPQYKDKRYVLDKLLAFHEEHNTAAAAILRDLEAATLRLPSSDQAAEAAPLRKRLGALTGRLTIGF
jgi:hypothetical protein